MRVAKKALHISKFLQKGLEYKHVTYDITGLGVSWSGIIMPNLNQTIQGLGDTARVGDKIFCTSLYLGFSIVKGALDCNVRILCFWDKQNTIVAPLNIIDSVGGPLAPVSDYHVDQRREWTKIFDRNFVCTNTNTNVHSWRPRLKLRKISQFDAGGTIINTGRLAIMYITDVPVGQPIADYSVINAFSRCFYTDM